MTLLSIGSFADAETVPLPEPFPVADDQVMIDAFKISEDKATEQQLLFARVLHVGLACRSWALTLDALVTGRTRLARVIVNDSEEIVEATRFLINRNTPGSAARMRHEAELAEHQKSLEKAKAQLEAAIADRSEAQRRLAAVNSLILSSLHIIRSEFPDQAKVEETPELDGLHNEWLEQHAEPPKCEKSYMPTIEWAETKI